MCGRFAQVISPQLLFDFFKLESVPEQLSTRYNIAPTQRPLGIRLGRNGERRATSIRWGLIPSWAKNATIGNRLINARNETLSAKPAFRSALKRRRCVIPASGYFEWARGKGGKKPYYIHGSGGILSLAGLWERWHDGAETTVDSFTIITTDAPESLAHLHHRAPLMLAPEDVSAWLDPATNQDAITGIRERSKTDHLTILAVGTYVNKGGNEDPRCVEALRT